MTFLCTVDGDLVPGHPWGTGSARTGADGCYDWPQPWALRCNRCELVFEYGGGSQTGPDEHHCATCLPIVKRERHGRERTPWDPTDEQLQLVIV